jgi:hypothetical protein
MIKRAALVRIAPPLGVIATDEALGWALRGFRRRCYFQLAASHRLARQRVASPGPWRTRYRRHRETMAAECARVAVVSELDIWCAAKLLIAQHGGRAIRGDTARRPEA